MNSRTEISRTSEMKTGRIDDAVKRYGLGKNSMRELAKVAKAEIRIGKAVLYNFSKIDNYLDNISE